jgi:hypothetical protein
MSYTMSEVVTAALKRIRVINARKTPDAVTADDGLKALNAMMHAWKGNGVDINHMDLDAADDFPLDDEFVQGVIALLAIRLSDAYGMQPAASIVLDAEKCWSALLAEYVSPADATFDNGLTRLTMFRSW